MTSLEEFNTLVFGRIGMCVNCIIDELADVGGQEFTCFVPAIITNWALFFSLPTLLAIRPTPPVSSDLFPLLLALEEDAYIPTSGYLSKRACWAAIYLFLLFILYIAIRSSSSSPVLPEAGNLPEMEMVPSWVFNDGEYATHLRLSLTAVFSLSSEPNSETAWFDVVPGEHEQADLDFCGLLSPVVQRVKLQKLGKLRPKIIGAAFN